MLIGLLRGAGIEIACNAQPVLFDSRQFRTQGTIRCPFAARPLWRPAPMCAAFGWLRHCRVGWGDLEGIGLLPDAARALPIRQPNKGACPNTLKFPVLIDHPFTVGLLLSPSEVRPSNEIFVMR